MKTNNTFEVTVDCICMKSTSVWSELQNRIDLFNVQNGRKTGLDNIMFDLELDCPVTCKKLRNAIDQKSIDIIGYAPYCEVEEGKCAVSTVCPKDEYVIIEMNGVGEAQELSQFADDLVYRGFVDDDSPDYEDYKHGERIGTGSFS